MSEEIPVRWVEETMEQIKQKQEKNAIAAGIPDAKTVNRYQTTCCVRLYSPCQQKQSCTKKRLLL